MRDISKTFPGVKALLRKVDLDVAQGEVLALAGENGAGKSTLMKVMTGVFRADPGGAILVEGTPVDDPRSGPCPVASASASSIRSSRWSRTSTSPRTSISRKEPLRPWRLYRQAPHAAGTHGGVLALLGIGLPARDTGGRAAHRPETARRDRQGDVLRCRASSSWTSRPRP